MPPTPKPATTPKPAVELGPDDKPLVQVRIPKHHGSVYSSRRNGKDVEYKGGDLALVTQREQDIYNFPLPEAPPEAAPAAPVVLTDEEADKLKAGRLEDPKGR